MVRNRKSFKGIARKISVTIPLFLALLLAAGPNAIAQTQIDTETVDTDPGASVEEAETALEALENARAALSEAPAREVTFAEVLADPDNIALNFAFAKSEVQKGRLKSAASTLERLLILEPNLHEVRLFYALVLIRLDSLDSAERELRQLERLDMEPSLRVELEGLLAQIEDAQSRWNLSLLTGIGANYDWNVNAVPKDRIRLAAGIPTTLDDADDRISDFSFTGFARWDVAYDLGMQARHELIGSVMYYLDDQVIHDPIDIGSLIADVGVKLRYPDLTITPRIASTTLWLSREQYFSSLGFSLDAEYALPPDQTLFGGISYTQERFYEITETTSGPDQNGPRIGFVLGLETDFDQQNRLTVTYEAGYKRGVPMDETRFDHNLTLSHLYLFDHGGFLNSSFQMSQDRELRPDPADDPGNTRKDVSGKLRLTYGAPVGALVDLDWLDPRLEQGLKNTVASVTAEAYRNNSTIRNYRYWNRRAEVLLTRKWTF